MQIHQLLENIAAIERANNGISYIDEFAPYDKGETAENDMLMEQQKAAEALNTTNAEIDNMKRPLKLSYDRNMSQKAQLVESVLRNSLRSARYHGSMSSCNIL
ncbi:unnamed protein product [Arabis nemorensis]|uniref:Uncharacterized protein n=1 Tax=Arabis nemorensis TaxID=586526 RepID=A0A565CDQ0_9BRAS|nr:unnamed protein product [Arabis nemorensis]